MDHFSFHPIFFLDSLMVSNVGLPLVLPTIEKTIKKRKKKKRGIGGRMQKRMETIKKIEDNELENVTARKRKKFYYELIVRLSGKPNVK